MSLRVDIYVLQARYTELLQQAAQPTEASESGSAPTPVDPNALFLEVVGKPRKGRLYGVGSQVSVASTSNSYPTTGSHITQRDLQEAVARATASLESKLEQSNEAYCKLQDKMDKNNEAYHNLQEKLDKQSEAYYKLQQEHSSQLRDVQAQLAILASRLPDPAQHQCSSSASSSSSSSSSANDV